MSWNGEQRRLSDRVSVRDALWVVLGVTVAVAVLVMLLGALSASQSSGKAPSYTCAPGETYTIKECQ